MKQYRAYLVSTSIIGIIITTYFYSDVIHTTKKNNIIAYSDEAARVYMEQPEDIAPAIKILSDGLAEHPDAAILLEARGKLYCEHGMLPECRADALQLLESKPDRIEPRMMLCMLNEFEGADQQACDDCYGKIVALLAAKPPASSPECERADKATYIFALLMARHFDAEKERLTFLEKIKSDPKEWIYRGMFADFERRQVLRQIFGQTGKAPLQ